MSNPEASRVYELILDAVVNEVREDFENAGIDEQTLQDLKRVWQLKLSETRVAKFSWDPQDNEVQQTTNTLVNGNDNSNIEDSSSAHVKNNAVPSEYSLNNESQGLVLPGFSAEDTNKPDQTNSSSAENQSNQRSQEEASSDGAQGGVDSESHPQENSVKKESDTKLENSQEIELTLSYPNGQEADILKQEAKKAKRSALLDTDEVGSELDDSDDDYLISEGEEDGPDENLMLCLYDKVTRTKARWKCSLKDGIATINRKDFTFQKSQVEAEWV